MLTVTPRVAPSIGGRPRKADVLTVTPRVAYKRDVHPFETDSKGRHSLFLSVWTGQLTEIGTLNYLIKKKKKKKKKNLQLNLLHHESVENLG